MKGGLGAQHRGLFDASLSAVWLAIASSFIQSLASSRRASPEIGQPPYTEAVDELVHAVAGRHSRPQLSQCSEIPFPRRLDNLPRSQSALVCVHLRRILDRSAQAELGLRHSLSLVYEPVKLRPKGADHPEVKLPAQGDRGLSSLHLERIVSPGDAVAAEIL
jgi:hypothetical protein